MYFEELVRRIPEDDEIALFYQLLMHHDLYKRRFDLLRKYKSVLR